MQRPIISKSFTHHLFIAAQGFEPIKVVPDGGGGIFFWPPEAAEAAAKFLKVKTHLNALLQAAEGAVR